MSDRSPLLLYSGGHKGTEAEFGRCADRWGIGEITFSFPGHQMEWSRGVRVLSPAELAQGDVSMAIVSRHMGRSYTKIELVRRVIQSMYHIVVNAYQVFAVGWIQPDGTVQGGTGWGVELAKLFNRPVSVFDQDRNHWFTWQAGIWVPDTPVIGDKPFAATGTRRLTDSGRTAIAALFERSLGPAPERAPAAPAPTRSRPSTRARGKAGAGRKAAGAKSRKAAGKAVRRKAPSGSRVKPRGGTRRRPRR